MALSFAGADRRALGIMRLALRQGLTPLVSPDSVPAADLRPDCDDDLYQLAPDPEELEALRTRVYACYGWAQSHIVVGGDTLDRLRVLGALARTERAERRRELFLALDPGCWSPG